MAAVELLLGSVALALSVTLFATIITPPPPRPLYLRDLTFSGKTLIWKRYKKKKSTLFKNAIQYTQSMVDVLAKLQLGLPWPVLIPFAKFCNTAQSSLD